MPSLAFEALFTTTALPPDDAVVGVGVELVCDEEPEPFELPHAANASDATSAGMQGFKAERI
ncbi:MAG TPA: hypothetical protein VNX67_04120 [Solirubrobacteraceae bacterium]|nr:hypothetical protein [Solirubrobacteraceae bacterium]